MIFFFIQGENASWFNHNKFDLRPTADERQILTIERSRVIARHFIPDVSMMFAVTDKHKHSKHHPNALAHTFYVDFQLSIVYFKSNSVHFAV